MTQSEYDTLRSEITNNIIYWIKKYADEKDNVELADGILKWAIRNAKERQGVIKNFLNTEDGLSLCTKMFQEHYGQNEGFVLFTSSWVKRSGSETVKKLRKGYSMI